MAKNVKLNVKNTQLADAINLSGLKAKLKKRSEASDGGVSESAVPENAAGFHDTTESSSQVEAHADMQKGKKPARPKSKPISEEPVAAQAVHIEEKSHHKAAPQKHLDTPQIETAHKEPQQEKVIHVKAEKLEKEVLREPDTHQQETQQKAQADTSNAPVLSSQKAEVAESIATPQAPTPPKKIPTLPASMRNDEVGGMRLGPVQGAAQADSRPARPQGRGRDDRFSQQRPGDVRRSKAPGTGSSTAKPFEPFKDRARGIQPFTTPQPKPAPRPRPDASRGDGTREFRPATPGAPRSQDSRPPYREGNREGYRPPAGQPYSDQPQGSDRPQGDRPYTPRPQGDRPYTPRPPGDRPYTPRAQGDRPYTPRPPGDRPYGDRPYTPRPPGDRPYTPRPPGDRPYTPRTGSTGSGYQGTGGYQGSAPRREGGYQGTGGYQGGGYQGGARRDTTRVTPVVAANRTEKEGARVIEEERKPKIIRDNKPGKEVKGIKRPENKDDARVRHGYTASDDSDEVWRKKRPSKSHRFLAESQEARPQAIAVRIPISIKDLAERMKIKASQVIANLFLQGIIVTLNDTLNDETTIQFLGQEFGIEISIDTRVEDKMRVTGKSVREEIKATEVGDLITRPPVVAFMGHVDHGKTSLIDAIRKTNRVQGEVGAITQHIGAFQCTTSHGGITILDTPGHEAFSSMRERGAEITDIVVLVVAGDEGMKEQTIEALNQARTANTTIVVAINKCDKPGFDQEKVYRQLAENNLLPEAWGGQTVTVNCSATTGVGISSLVEMLALQAEVLELRANTASRARGRVVESQMQKGLGSVATLLIQNGTLHTGDCLVFECEWAKVKTMRNDAGKEVTTAGPSTPVLITGLSDLPSAGEEFIVVGSEKDAKEIASMRQEGRKQTTFMKKRQGLESMLQKGALAKKVLNVILRADVQGSLEALKTALEKIQSDKVEVNIISVDVGEISESDVQLAATSKATILGFHTQIESHAASLIKSLGVTVREHNIIYHAVDDVRDLMKGLLDKIAQETDKGKAEVKATFKSSHLGIIAGCQVIEGTIERKCHIRVRRDGKEVWRGPISSLKRFKDDVREVAKGHECGIVLQGYAEYLPGDFLEAYEVTYLTQEL